MKIMIQPNNEDLRTTYVELCNVKSSPAAVPVVQDNKRNISPAPPRHQEVPHEIKPNNYRGRRLIKPLKDCNQSLSVNDAEYFVRRLDNEGKRLNPSRSPLVRQHSHHGSEYSPQNIHFIVDDDLPSGTCLSCVFHSMPRLIQSGSQYFSSCANLIPVVHDPWYNTHYVDHRKIKQKETMIKNSPLDPSDEYLNQASQQTTYGNYLTVPASPARTLSQSTDEGIVYDAQPTYEPNTTVPEHQQHSVLRPDGHISENSYINEKYQNYGQLSQHRRNFLKELHHEVDYRGCNNLGDERRRDYKERGKSISDVGSRREFLRQPSETRSEGGRMKRVLPDVPQASSFLRLHWRKPDKSKLQRENAINRRANSIVQDPNDAGPSYLYDDIIPDPNHENINTIPNAIYDEKKTAGPEPITRQPKKNRTSPTRILKQLKGHKHASFDATSDRLPNHNSPISSARRTAMSQRSKTVDYSNNKNHHRRKDVSHHSSPNFDDSPASSSSSANIKNSYTSKKVIEKKMNNEISDADESENNVGIINSPTKSPKSILRDEKRTKSIDRHEPTEGSKPEDSQENAQECLTKRLMEVGPADPQRVQVIVQDVLYEMGAERILQYKDAFGKFDKDCIGTISSKQLRRLLRTLGHNPRDDELRELVNQVDMDENGKIDFNEFIIMIGYFDKANNTSEDLSNIFRVYDGGSINVDELRGVCSKYLTECVPMEKINEMIEFVDRDGDGEIERDELTRVWSNRW